MQQKQETLHSELNQELQNILQYWMHYSVDNINGGFYGSVKNNNEPAKDAAKGVVLHARILWTFSVSYQYTEQESLLSIAERAYDYITAYFIDREYGGVYWSVNEKGELLEDRKQIYGLAFCIYGLSAYASITNNKEALDYAIQLHNLIEKYSYDPLHKGYFEAFSRDWTSLNDLRLSAKDVNEKKTMNTHLHIVEAYAALYKTWPNEKLKNKIAELLLVIDEHFINKRSYHLRLFFDETWNENIDVISYGHDIEAAWLLLQCAEIIEDNSLIAKYKQHAIGLTNAAMRGLDIDGGLWYEFDQNKNHLIKEKHWWPQAEAMIGFFNAYELTKDDNYLEHCFNSWSFIKKYLIDKKNGEWFWGIKEDHTIMPNEDKAGFWKCPYHNARACVEIIRRIERL